MRRPIVAANWKMHKTQDEASRFVRELLPRVGAEVAADVVIAPPFPLLPAVARALADAPHVSLAAQNVHSEASGAFTGEVSCAMLADAGCRYVIVGHSERRALFGESDAFVARKVAAVQRAGMRPILCVGETLEQREAGQTEAVLTTQLAGSLADLDEARAAELVIAYEPVWAIGTGRTATSELAQTAHALLRAQLRARLGAVAEAIRLQYGGSVRPENAKTLLGEPDIDGALVGGASLDPESFAAIVHAAA
jgi:triosephosphate isomerase